MKPRFDGDHYDLTRMTSTRIGRTTSDDLQKHPSGWVFVKMDDGAIWLRTDKNPVWEKISDGKE